MLNKQFTSYTSFEESLVCAIRMSNKEPKEVAALLWPSEPIERAYSRLMDAMNPHKKQKLSFYEIIRIMHITDRHDPLFYLADECLYERPEKRSIKIEHEAIMSKMNEMFEKFIKEFHSGMTAMKKHEEIEKIRAGKDSNLELVVNTKSHAHK